MDTVYLSFARTLLTAFVAGIVGGLGMIGAMRFITRSEWAHYDMIAAVGSLVTRSRENAIRTGLVIHTISAVVFAYLYTAAMAKFGLAHLPTSIFAGVVFGVLQGFIVSILLVWVVAEQHPLEEFRGAGFAVGLVHFVGHIVYGALVGLVIGAIAG